MPQPIKRLRPKNCAHCGARFSRKRFGNRLEDATRFRLRKFCSITCAGFRDRPLTKWGYAARARKLLKPACEACRSTRKLVAHHVDQDPSNNTPENMQTLCKICHDGWHWKARKAGRSIAGRMPPLP